MAEAPPQALVRVRVRVRDTRKQRQELLQSVLIGAQLSSTAELGLRPPCSIAELLAPRSSTQRQAPPRHQPECTEGLSANPHPNTPNPMRTRTRTLTPTLTLTQTLTLTLALTCLVCAQAAYTCCGHQRDGERAADDEQVEAQPERLRDLRARERRARRWARRRRRWCWQCEPFKPPD